MTKKEEKVVSDDRKAQNIVGGVTPTKLAKTVKVVNSCQADLAKIRGDMGSEIKSFEEEGGNKKALKWALSLQSMEEDQRSGFVRDLRAYCDELKVFAQGDLFSDNAVPAVQVAKAVPPQRTATDAIVEAHRPKGGKLAEDAAAFQSSAAN